MDAHADLSLRCTHMPTYTFSWTPAHLLFFSGIHEDDGFKYNNILGIVVREMSPLHDTSGRGIHCSIVYTSR